MIIARIWIKKLRSDGLLLFFGGLLLLLLAIKPDSFSRIPRFIHWPTIIALTGLLITTTGIKESGIMELLIDRLVHVVHTERTLWLALIFFSAIIAAFLTNDIALFLIIPFTLNLSSRMEVNIRPLLILETIAVNVGSMFTPIGNPQNIYLWQKTKVSFFSFTGAMLPAGLLELILLLILVFIVASAAPLESRASENRSKTDHKLALISALMLVSYLIAQHLGAGPYVVGFIALFFLLAFHKIFKLIDWSLIILFLLLFVDTGIIETFHWVDAFIATIPFTKPFHILLAGAGYSQIISNVPATLLLSHYTNQWKYLAWGVNIGGNGLLIASFANLIATRLAGKHKIGWYYHWYSIPFLIVSFLVVYGWVAIG